MMLQALLSQPHDHRRVHDLANLLGIEAPSVTRKSQELEQAGYVRRVPDKHDRRAISLQVTPRGRAVSERISQAQRELIREALSAWDKESRRKFVKLFQQFTENLAIASIEQPVEKGKKIGEK
jgi:DNA-binding MarR family transcriptional regulator